MVEIIGEIKGLDICHRCKKEVNRIVQLSYGPDHDHVIDFFTGENLKVETRIENGIFRNKSMKFVKLKCIGEFIFQQDNQIRIRNVSIKCYD